MFTKRNNFEKTIINMSEYTLVIVALTLIYAHSTNAVSRYLRPSREVEENLRDERPRFGPLGTSIAKISGKINIVCDILSEDEKQLICDEMMPHIHRATRSINEFESYAEGNASQPAPPTVDPAHPYECKKLSIEDLNMKKRMYWCRSRRFKKRNSDDFDEEPGFFVAASRNIKGRIFAFRPSNVSSGEVRCVGEMDGVAVVRNYVLPYYLYTKNNMLSSSVAPSH